MKVILKENVVSLGYKDDVVEVKDGYGRNYLIPQGIAIIASDAALKRLAEEQRQRAHKLEKIHAEAEATAAALAELKLSIPARASKTGSIYGSVNAVHLAEALAALGHNIDKKIIFLKDPVKQIGEYSATVKLLKDVTADLAFEVIAESVEE